MQEVAQERSKRSDKTDLTAYKVPGPRLPYSVTEEAGMKSPDTREQQDYWA